MPRPRRTVGVGGADVTDDLQTLLELWQEKLQIETGSSY
jgi:hypothetical protein